MLSKEQSKAQDEYLSSRHKRFDEKENRVWVDANELTNFVCNMDVPKCFSSFTDFADAMSHVIDIIDLAGSLDNPQLDRGWLFSWEKQRPYNVGLQCDNPEYPEFTRSEIIKLIENTSENYITEGHSRVDTERFAERLISQIESYVK